MSAIVISTPPLSGGQLAEQLWPTDEDAKQETAVYNELPQNRQERNRILDDLSERAFSDDEKQKWDSETRRAIVAFGFAGYLELHETGTDGVRQVHCNLEKFKSPDVTWTQLSQDLGSIVYENTSRGTRRKTIAQTLADFSENLGKIRALNDDSNTDEKELFYVPGSGALNPKIIKETAAHLGLWETYPVKTFSEKYPTKESGFEENVTDVVVSALVFGQNWGNGFRDEEGILQVRYPDGTTGRLTGDFFKKWGFSGRVAGINECIYNKPQSYLDSHCAQLLEQDVISLDDFRGHSGEGGIYEEKRLTGRNFKHKGSVTVDGVIYYLGTKYENDRYSVTKLSSEYAVVIRKTRRGSGEQQEIDSIFRLLSADEKKSLKQEKSFPFLTRTELEEIGIFSPEQFVQKVPEAEQVFEEWKNFLKFSNSLEAAGVKIMDYTLRQQTQLWEVFSRDPNLKVESFIGGQQLSDSEIDNRVKTLLVLAGNVKNLSKMVEIAKNGNVEFLFENIAAISDIVSNFEEYQRQSDIYSDVELDRMRQISDMILRHSSRLFLSAHEVLNKDKSVSIQDVTFVLYRYRKSVEKWHYEQFLRSGSSSDNPYLRLLGLFDESDEGSNMQTLLLSMIEQYWRDDVVRESTGMKKSSVSVLDRIKGFYDGNKELFETAAETTGDTQTELQALEKFFNTFEKIDGYVLDLACGDRKRITEPMAEMLRGKAKGVIGMDIWSPGENTVDGLHVVQGDIGSIPLASDSVDVATLNWSPPNDWVSRTEQLVNFDEIGRVMKANGVIRLDVAHLEGGEGSWMKTVTEQHSDGAEKFGDMKVMFPGGREGEFHIYPASELRAMLTNAGFGNIALTRWTTKSGKPRVVITADFKGHQNPIR